MFELSTHTFKFCQLPWYLGKIRVDKFFLSFFNHALPEIQSQAGIALLQARSRLSKMRRATDVI